MKIWKLILGFLGLVGGLFAANATKSKKVKELKKVIKENKKEGYIFVNDAYPFSAAFFYR